MKYVLPVLLLSTFAITSCDKQEIKPIQDPSAISFKQSILPIANNKCLECHQSTAAVTLYSSESWKSLDQAGRLLPVIVNEAHVYTEERLTKNEQEVILKWIELGYPN